MTLSLTSSRQEVQGAVSHALSPDHHGIRNAILDSAAHAVIATCREGIIRYCNRAALDMLGYAWDELVNIHTPMVIHDHQEVEQRASELSSELGRPIAPGFEVFVARTEHYPNDEREWTYIRRDGSRLHVLLSVSPLLDHYGQFTGYVGIASDISEKKRENQKLQIAATAFESQAAIVVTDPEQRILCVNEAFTRLTGYTAEQVLGKTPSLLSSGLHHPDFYKGMWQSLRETDHWQGEIWNRRRNGEIYPEWLTITGVRGSRGELTNYVATFSDISALKEAESEIRELAFYDPLTHLPNRRLLMERLGRALANSRRSNHTGALIMIDFDHFKRLNDTEGHEAGDALLVEAASRLRRQIRDVDTVARLGGDEFVVILEDLGSETGHAAIHARNIAEKLRLSLGQPYRLPRLQGEFEGSVSIGVSLFQGNDTAVEDLFKQADIALYKAKEEGRNTVSFFDHSMQSRLELRTRMEGRLRRALANREFLLHFQPQLNRHGQIIGAEALLRWQPEGCPLVPPGVFIPLAEESGLIVPISQWVLETACACLATWSGNRATENLALAINISARQFKQLDFVDSVRHNLAQHQILPHRLKLELTESLMLDDLEITVERMQELKAIGVGLSLDDFGTGYASLSYLKRLPFDQLKIDRSFVQDITTDSDAAAIVQAILAMAQTLGLELIAEGVETEEQRQFLESHGCAGYQGYLFSHPLPLREVEGYLDQMPR